VHVPVAEQPSPVEPQEAQTAPATAHWVPVRGETQVPLAVAVQQPAPQEVASQMQTPPEQRCPAAQAAAPPQEHRPVVAEQPSAYVALQPEHTWPAGAHWVAVRGATQVPPTDAVQQPDGHEVALHTHCPPSQRWPPATLQAAPPPQVQPPAAEQPSAELAVQAAQTAPLAAHCAAVRPVMQLPPTAAVQHPLVQEVALHTHCPPSQRWPAATLQAAAAPQAQVPDAEQESAPAAQSAQSAPAAAHCEAVRGATQLPPAAAVQQPAGQEVESHTHCPPWQRWPLPHAGPAPQLQAPAEEQPSPLAPQEAHAAPAAAHCVPVRGETQVPPAVAVQQPPGQEARSQTQVPPRQRCPPVTLQAAAPPQLQAPPAEQPSAPASQAAQTAPAAAHWAAVLGDTQAPPTVAVQQPPGQDWSSQRHAPPLQRWPAPQGALPPQVHWPAVEQPSPEVAHPWQRSPAGAQASSVVSVQVPPRSAVQQPVGQLVASHWQTPPRQRWPVAHRVPPPQAQVPVAEQPSATSPQSVHAPPARPQLAATCAMQEPAWQQLVGQLIGSHSQAPLTQRCPPGHGRFDPHWQAPAAEQASPDIPQSVHVPPSGPQAESVGAVQTLPSQQPVGQVLESQTQAPPRQRWPTVHCGPLPHRQDPVAEQASASSPQSVQAPPFTPQVAETCWAQAPAWQQLPGQERASHTQAPPLQRWPGGHAAPAPHRQAPATVHASPPGAQSTQFWPRGAQVEADSAVHTPATQHPVGQVVESQ
jgi:hypothetical protein